jgi:hypothetical protein
MIIFNGMNKSNRFGGAYEVDGGLDVLGDGGGALVLAGLVPVEPPHVVRL